MLKLKIAIFSRKYNFYKDKIEKEMGYFLKRLNIKKNSINLKCSLIHPFDFNAVIYWFIILYYFISVTSIVDGAKVPKKPFVKYPNNRYQASSLNQQDFSGNGK